MPSGLDKGDILAASNWDSDAMQRVLYQADNVLVNIQLQAGIDASATQQQAPGGIGTNSNAVPVPPTPSFEVLTVGNLFTVQITPPNVAQVLTARSMPGSNVPIGDPLGPNVARTSRSPNLQLMQNANTLRRLLYQIQAATDSAFTQNLRQWGPDSMLWYVIPVFINPPATSVTLFWRVRAQYQNSNFSGWATLNGAVTAGT